MATTLRLLIVEDQSYDAELAVAMLEAAGYACQWQRVETRDAFMGCLHTAEYDLILADYSLAAFDGMAALRLFLAYGLDIPFIFLSGTVGEETAIDSLKAGATDYIMKNRLERLVPVVQRALQERKAQRRRQQAEAQLRRMEQMYHQILNAITDLVVVKDPRSRIVWANKAFCDYSGLAQEHLRGWLDPPCDPQEAPQQSIQDDTSVFTTGQPLDFPEAPLTRYDGQVRLFHTVKSPIFDTQGHVSQLVAVCRDITERRQAEANRYSLEEQLFQAQKMRSIGTLAAGAAHDFNNLLSVILSSIDLMRDEIHPQDTLLHTRLANIEGAAERAAPLTRQMLAFSRDQRMERRTLDLHDTIDNLLKMLRRIIGEDVEVCLHTVAEVSPVCADPGQIEQLLMNLAVNARDAMPNGGQLRIDIGNVTLNAAYCQEHPWARPGQYVQLRVSDTGHGMDAETSQRIFEPFFTTRDVGKGTGLGLSVVHGIVKQHEGLIHVCSEVGHGTTFNIYLPVAPQRLPIVAHDIVPAPLYGTETLLVAEDEDTMRMLAHTALTRLGYTVLLARDGQEAVQVYTEHQERIALLILDVIMPRQGGRETYTQIRAMGSTAPVLFVTGYSPHLARGTLVACANAPVLQKPYSIRTLGHTVRELLDRVA